MNFDGIIAAVSGFDTASILGMFWYLLFLEGPRYLIANVAMVFSSRRQARLAAVPAHFSVSIILPAHNGAAGVIKSVASLREQTFKNIQIIVVNDGSTDDMAQVCMRLQRDGLIETYLSNGMRGGKSASLNLGLRYCTGDIVISVDADTTFDRDAIQRILRSFDDPEIGCVGGNVGVRNFRSSLLSAMQAVEYMVSISLGRKVSLMLGIVPVASGAFSAFRREALLSVGGWEAGPGEDGDLTLKLRRAGWKVGFAADAWALTDAPVTIAGLINQRLRWESDLARLHLQKFRPVPPWKRHFSLSDTVASLDILFFSVGLSLAFFVYVFWITATFGIVAIPILIASSLIYSLLGLATFLLAAALSENRLRIRLLPYALGYSLYCMCILHPVRAWAYLDELIFGRSLRSNFVPKKVLNRIARF